jgi:hypothetical protein
MRLEGLQFKDSPGKKFVGAHFNRKGWMVVHTHFHRTVGSLRKEGYSPGWPNQKERPYLKNNQSKKGWRHGSSHREPV